MKKQICFWVALCLLCGALLSGCSRPPKVEDIREEVIKLVEASYEINEVFYGAGLPVLDRNSEEYADYYTYYASTLTNSYDIVDASHAKFTCIAEIKAAAEQVYSLELLEGNLYVNAFTGYAISGIGSDVISSDSLFQEDQEYLYQSVSRKNYLTHGMKIFDYDTMKIIQPSYSKAIYITMNSWYAPEPENIIVERIRLTLGDSGWRLDSLTV